MTPEEILQAAPINGWSDKQVVSRILQWGREMCDKQKQECVNEWVNCSKDRNYELMAITRAPYPKELQ